MAVSQVGDVIRLALQELEVLGAGDNPSADEYADGVDWLNIMLSNWEADESLKMTPNLLTNSFVTTGAASYTNGSGGTAFAIRPIRIVSAYVSFQGVDTPLAIKGKADYNKLQNKAVAGPPGFLFYVPSHPLGVISFDRVVEAGYTIVCELQSPVGDYSTQNDLLAVSPEYRAAMVYNLAVALAPSYKTSIRPQTAAMAKRTLERLQYQSHNAQVFDAWPTSELIV